jgi:TFIIF-interacting CTD phosphatase-like protein
MLRNPPKYELVFSLAHMVQSYLVEKDQSWPCLPVQVGDWVGDISNSQSFQTVSHFKQSVISNMMESKEHWMHQWGKTPSLHRNVSKKPSHHTLLLHVRHVYNNLSNTECLVVGTKWLMGCIQLD